MSVIVASLDTYRFAEFKQVLWVAILLKILSGLQDMIWFLLN